MKSWVLKKRKCGRKVGDNISNVFNQRTWDQCPFDRGFVNHDDDEDDGNDDDDDEDDGDDYDDDDDDDDEDDEDNEYDHADDFNERTQDQCPFDRRFVIHIPCLCAVCGASVLV